MNFATSVNQTQLHRSSNTKLSLHGIVDRNVQIRLVVCTRLAPIIESKQNQPKYSMYPLPASIFSIYRISCSEESVQYETFFN